MRQSRRALALGLTMSLAVAGLTVTSVGPATADAPGEPGIWVTAPATGAVLRGDEATLETYFDNTACYGGDDAGQWSVDGVPLAGTVTPFDGGQETTSGPGLPAGDYISNDVTWDATSVADGQHTATLLFNGTDCATGDGYQQTRSVSFNVDNSPIGIHFSRPGGARISGSAVPLTISTTDPHANVDGIDWSGSLVKEQNGTTAVLDTVGLNGRHTVTVSVTDDADVTTTATLTLEVVTPAPATGRPAGRSSAGSAPGKPRHVVRQKHRVARHRVLKHRPAKRHVGRH